MSQDTHWQLQIQRLTQQESWDELDALYENLIAQAQDSSQKLFLIFLSRPQLSTIVHLWIRRR